MILSKLAINGVNLSKSSLKLYSMPVRNFVNESRSGTIRRSLKSKFFQSGIAAETKPLTDTPIRIGRGVIAGGAALGLGALAFYGLGFSKEAGILDQSATWPAYVKERVRTTYTYFGASLGITAAAAVAAAKSPAIMNLLMRNSITSTIVTFAMVIGSGILVQSIPYQQGTFGSKQLAWILHSSLLGAMVAPMTLLGGPLLVRAAWYTAGVVGGLSLVAATAPSDKFLYMGGPLAIGLGVVFASSVAGMFLPPTTRLGLNLYSLSIYGGLVLFSMFLLYDTQKIVHRAQTTPHYDPINHSISIYLDTLNIFIRIATILSTGNSRRK